MNTITMKRDLRFATASVAVVAFWAIAAVFVAAVPSFVGKLAVIGLVAGGYMRFVAREGTIEHALFVGITWAVLSIVTEMVVEMNLEPNWNALIGSPDEALFRNTLLLMWVAAPALYARGRS